MSDLRLIESPASPKKKILFLGYTEEHTTLIDALVKANCEVWHSQEKIDSISRYDLVVSYGYRHIFKKALLESSSPDFS